MSSADGRMPSRLVVVAGTYDGVLAGWDTRRGEVDEDEDIELKLLRRNDGRHLRLSFAMAAHEGSVRCIDVSGAAAAAAASSSSAADGKKKGKKRQRGDSVDGDDSKEDPAPEPGALLSGGYDETINVYSLQKGSQTGELKTPAELGSPLCCSFAPPSNHASSISAVGPPTHALVGLTSGKIVLYKRRDWSVQHVLSGHDAGGVQCLAVHPTGRMALSGGRRDGKIVLWDLTKGRLAFVHKISKGGGGAGRGGGGGSSSSKETVNHIVWSGDGNRYAYCHGNRITARDVSGGDELLDVEMPSRVNQLAFVGGPEGMFVAAACDDGGLPVLEVGKLIEDEDDDDDEEEGGRGGGAESRRAIMAIEPVEDRVVAGDDRLKCIRSVEGGSGFLVVTANSGGVVSLMDLEGAARMMLAPSPDEDDDDEEDGGGGRGGRGSDDDSEEDSDREEEEVEAAVEILDSVRVGSGARITDLAVWSHGGEGGPDGFEDALDEDGKVSDDDSDGVEAEVEDDDSEEEEEEPAKKRGKVADDKRKENGKNGGGGASNKIELDAEAVERARKLVGQAKVHQKKEKRRREKRDGGKKKQK